MVKFKISEALRKAADRIEESSTDEKVQSFISDATEAYKGFRSSRKEHQS